MIQITKELSQKVLETVDCGLSSGLGNPVPGEMCIEAAVNYACGLPHGDNPSCVGYAVRAYKIQLNDCNWSSKEARAKGMRKIAIAQLGSNELNQIEFSSKIALKTVTILLPFLFRKLGKEEIAIKLENCKTIEEGIIAAESAAEYAAKSAAKSAKSAKYAAKYAAKSAESAAKSAKSAKYAAESAAEYAAKSAEYAAKSAEYAAKSAEYAEYATIKYNQDEFLCLGADICLQVLIEMKSPGCEYLFLTICKIRSLQV